MSTKNISKSNTPEQRSPAFQFYPKDFLTDMRVVLMSHEVRGMYITLLCHDWLQDGIPAESAAALCGMTNASEGWLKGGCQMVEGCFTNHPTKVGYLTSPTLIRAREIQANWRAKSVEGGKKSAEARKRSIVESSSPGKGGSTTALTTVPTKGQPKGNSSSPSSSPSPYIDDLVVTNVTTISSPEPENTKSKLPKITLAPKLSMTKDQAMNLIEEFGKESCEYYKKVCSDYLVSKGKTMKDAAAFMRNWIRREIAERRGFYYPKQNGYQPHTAANTAQKNLEYLEAQYGKEGIKGLLDVVIDSKKELSFDRNDRGSLVPIVTKPRE